jgi:hypothetical protein
MGFSQLGNAFTLDIVSDRVAPPFLQGTVGKQWLQTMGQGLDLVRWRSAQAMLVHLPGQGDPTGLYYIGLDDVRQQGPNETNTAYGARLQLTYDAWQTAGSAWGLLRETLAILSPAQPMARTVSDLSVWDWYTEGQNPTTTTPTHYTSTSYNWNWDNEGDPVSPFAIYLWWRLWMIFFAGTTAVGNVSTVSSGIASVSNSSPIQITLHPTVPFLTGAQVYIEGLPINTNANGVFTVTVTGANSFTLNGTTGGASYTVPTSPSVPVYVADSQNWTFGEGTWGDGDTWGASSNGTKSWGLSVPYTTIRKIQQTIVAWMAANAWGKSLIVSLDPTAFDPNQNAGSASPAGNNPDGTYHWLYKIVAHQYVAARNPMARYCDMYPSP